MELLHTLTATGATLCYVFVNIHSIVHLKRMTLICISYNSVNLIYMTLKRVKGWSNTFLKMLVKNMGHTVLLYVCKVEFSIAHIK